MFDFPPPPTIAPQFLEDSLDFVHTVDVSVRHHDGYFGVFGITRPVSGSKFC